MSRAVTTDSTPRNPTSSDPTGGHSTSGRAREASPEGKDREHEARAIDRIAELLGHRWQGKRDGAPLAVLRRNIADWGIEAVLGALGDAHREADPPLKDAAALVFTMRNRLNPIQRQVVAPPATNPAMGEARQPAQARPCPIAPARIKEMPVSAEELAWAADPLLTALGATALDETSLATIEGLVLAHHSGPTAAAIARICRAYAPVSTPSLVLEHAAAALRADGAASGGMTTSPTRGPSVAPATALPSTRATEVITP